MSFQTCHDILAFEEYSQGSGSAARVPARPPHQERTHGRVLGTQGRRRCSRPGTGTLCGPVPDYPLPEPRVPKSHTLLPFPWFVNIPLTFKFGIFRLMVDACQSCATPRAVLSWSTATGPSGPDSRRTGTSARGLSSTKTFTGSSGAQVITNGVY